MQIHSWTFFSSQMSTECATLTDHGFVDVSRGFSMCTSKLPISVFILHNFSIQIDGWNGNNLKMKHIYYNLRWEINGINRWSSQSRNSIWILFFRKYFFVQSKHWRLRFGWTAINGIKANSTIFWICSSTKSLSVSMPIFFTAGQMRQRLWDSRP